MLFEGSLFELNVRWLLAIVGLIIFIGLAQRANRGKRDLPDGADVWRDKWFRPLIFVGLGFFILWIFLLLAYDI